MLIQISKFKYQSDKSKFKNLLKFWIFIFGFLLGCQQKPYYKETQFLMGTVVEIVAQDKQAFDLAFAEIKRIEKLLNKFDRQSEISLLNKQGSLKVSPDTFFVIKRSKEFSQLTDGAFDITVAPLVDLWKESINKKRLPAQDKIRASKTRVGFQNLLLDEKNLTVKFTKMGMEIDLGGIAKGYAVDCAIRKLKNSGIKSCLISAGGHIYALGKKGNVAWRVGIQHPRKTQKMAGYLNIANQAVATSGDYQQYFLDKGRRYSHIIEPQTGYPVNNGIVSVTVVADDCLTADALSTSIFVLGQEKGLELAQRFKNVGVRIITEKILEDAPDSQ